MNHEELKAFIDNKILPDEFRATGVDRDDPVIRIELHNSGYFSQGRLEKEDSGSHEGEPCVRLSFDVDGTVTCYTEHGPGGGGRTFKVAEYAVSGRFSCLTSIKPEGARKKFFVIKGEHSINLTKNDETIIDQGRFPEAIQKRARKLVAKLDVAIATRLSLRGEQNTFTDP